MEPIGVDEDRFLSFVRYDDGRRLEFGRQLAGCWRNTGSKHRPGNHLQVPEYPLPRASSARQRSTRQLHPAGRPYG